MLVAHEQAHVSDVGPQLDNGEMALEWQRALQQAAKSTQSSTDSSRMAEANNLLQPDSRRGAAEVQLGADRWLVTDFLTPHKLAVLALVDLVQRRQRMWPHNVQRGALSVVARLTAHQPWLREPALPELCALIRQRVPPLPAAATQTTLDTALCKHIAERLARPEDIQLLLDAVYGRIETDAAAEEQALSLRVRISTASKLAQFVRRAYMEAVQSSFGQMLLVWEAFRQYFNGGPAPSPQPSLPTAPTLRRLRDVASSPLHSVATATTAASATSGALPPQVVASSPAPGIGAAAASTGKGRRTQQAHMSAAATRIYSPSGPPLSRQLEKVIQTSLKRKASLTMSIRSAAAAAAAAAALGDEAPAVDAPAPVPVPLLPPVPAAAPEPLLLDDNNQPLPNDAADNVVERRRSGSQSSSISVPRPALSRASSSSSLALLGGNRSRASTPSMMRLRQMHIPSSSPAPAAASSGGEATPSPLPLPHIARTDQESAAWVDALVEKTLGRHRRAPAPFAGCLSAFDAERFLVRAVERGRTLGVSLDIPAGLIGALFPHAALPPPRTASAYQELIVGAIAQRSYTARTLVHLLSSEQCLLRGDGAATYRHLRNYFDVMTRQAGNQGVASLMGTNDLADLLACIELHWTLGHVGEAIVVANRAVVVARETKAHHELLRALNWLLLLENASAVALTTSLRASTSFLDLIRALPDPARLIVYMEKTQRALSTGPAAADDDAGPALEPRALARMAGLVAAENHVMKVFFLLQLVRDALTLQTLTGGGAPQRVRALGGGLVSRDPALASGSAVFAALAYARTLSLRIRNAKLTVALAVLEARALGEFGSARQAHSLLTRVLDSCAAKNAPVESVQALCVSAELHVKRRGDWAAAFEALARAAQIAPPEHVFARRPWLGALLVLVLQWLRRQGAFHAAEQVAIAAKALLLAGRGDAGAAQDPDYAIVLAIERARLLKAMGDPIGALDCVEPFVYPSAVASQQWVAVASDAPAGLLSDTLRASEALVAPRWRLEAAIVAAQIAADSSPDADALVRAASLLDQCLAAGRPALVLDCRLILVDLWIAGGQFSVAAAELEKAAQSAAVLVDEPHVRARVSLAKARLASARGDFEKALEISATAASDMALVGDSLGHAAALDVALAAARNGAVSTAECERLESQLSSLWHQLRINGSSLVPPNSLAALLPAPLLRLFQHVFCE